jgi:hypothetical protein
LQVVDRLSHVALCGKDERCESLVVVFHLPSALRPAMQTQSAYFLEVANLLETLEHFGISQLCITQNGATRLDGFDDLVGHVARQGESGSI